MTKLLRKPKNGSYRLVDKNIEFSKEEITILNLLILLSFFDNDLDKIDKYILFRYQRTTYGDVTECE